MPTSLDDIRQFAVDNNYRVTLKLIPLSQAPRYERERFEDLPTFPLSSNNLLDEINIETGGTVEHREWGTIRYDNGTFWCGDSIRKVSLIGCHFNDGYDIDSDSIRGVSGSD